MNQATRDKLGDIITAHGRAEDAWFFFLNHWDEPWALWRFAEDDATLLDTSKYALDKLR